MMQQDTMAISRKAAGNNIDIYTPSSFGGSDGVLWSGIWQRQGRDGALDSSAGGRATFLTRFGVFFFVMGGRVEGHCI